MKIKRKKWWLYGWQWTMGVMGDLVFGGGSVSVCFLVDIINETGYDRRIPFRFELMFLC
jgi:hypothetical protein